MPVAATQFHLTVSELNRKVKVTLDQTRELQGVWVIGELSNVRKNNSPHLFPRLKDDRSEIGLVIWGSIVQKYESLIKDGAKVLVRGNVRVFEARGVYQVYVDEIREVGIGELYARFEALKKKLRDEGLFEQERKLPGFPVTVGVVTSLTGAVIHDILRNLRGRYPPIRVIVAPVQVQGAGAGDDIARAIQAMNELSSPRPDVLIVGRGGGSIEDLWAFNEESVARALFASRIPTISAVGHQTDFTIADFVADKRAATPTEAAVDAVPDAEDLLGQVEGVQRALLDEMTELLTVLEERVARDADLLGTLDPRQVLRRGYSVVLKAGRPVASVSAIRAGDDLDIRMIDGSVDARVNAIRRTRRGS